MSNSGSPEYTAPQPPTTAALSERRVTGVFAPKNSLHDELMAAHLANVRDGLRGDVKRGGFGVDAVMEGYRAAHNFERPPVTFDENNRPEYLIENPYDEDTTAAKRFWEGLEMGTADKFPNVGATTQTQDRSTEQQNTPFTRSPAGFPLDWSSQSLLRGYQQQQRRQNVQDWRQMQARQATQWQRQRQREAMRRRRLAMQHQMLREAAEREREGMREMLRRMNVAEARAKQRREQERQSIREDLLNTFNTATQRYRQNISGIREQMEANEQRGLGVFDMGTPAAE